MKEKRKNVSMTDIAEIAGVSVATVSRVINKTGRYSAETEQRILKIIDEYRYVPNMAAKGLKTNRTNIIGVIVPDIINEFFAKIILEIQNHLRQAGYLAFICNTDENERIEREYVDMLSAVRTAGIIFVSGNTQVAEQQFEALPAIYIDRQPENADKENLLVVESDNYTGGRLAVQELYEKGCRKIAYMESKKPISTHKLRYQGYIDQLEEYGLTPDNSLHVTVESVTMDSAKATAQRFLQEKTDFDGIFCATDWLALGVVQALEEQSIMVPEQVKVVGFDDITVAQLVSKPLTTIRQDVEQMGRVASQEMINLLDGEISIAQHIKIPVELIVRETT